MYLNCHSYYSLRYGTLSVVELVRQAVDNGVKAMAITDINNTSAVFEFVRVCQKMGIHPIVGMEFHQVSKNVITANNPNASSEKYGDLLYIALAKNTNGFAVLNGYLSKANLTGEPLPTVAPAHSDVFIIYPTSNLPNQLKDNEYVGIKTHEIGKLNQPKFSAYKDKTVILHPVSIAGKYGDADHKNNYRLHKLLRAIDTNSLVTKIDINQLCQPNECMMPIDELLAYYKQCPDIVKRTEKLIDTCSFDFDFTTPKNKETYTGDYQSDKELLESLTLEGIQKRYGKQNSVALKRAVKELDIIDRMGFSAYFLITWDIVRYSQSRGFYHLGRGSGANSIVGYALGITNVCPLELNLYFERFLNPKRSSPPDFDIDWSWRDRDDILQYVFKRFETGKTAFIGTISRFKKKSTYRELGKTLGLPKKELDILAHYPKEMHPNSNIIRAIHRFGDMMAGFPNIRSIHACGVLVSEKHLNAYSPLTMPPKGFPTVQFDMHTGEDIGLEKLDILGQRGIGHIGDCVKLIQKNRGISVDIHNRLDKIKQDKTSNHLLKTGQTLGCFYIESPAMRSVLQKLKCEHFTTLVAATSIIRPGVAKSGMLQKFIQYHNAPEKVRYQAPAFETHLKDTYGIMVYQEDVIKIAHFFGGLDLADADVLRRAMCGKTSSQEEFDKIKQKFFDNCQQNGYSIHLAKEVYRQIESFAGFSFCKAHSASYSVESYQSLFLKAHYPHEFMTAVLNNFGGFYNAEVYFQEARNLGAIIENPCVNNSLNLTVLKGDKLYIGFNYLKNLERKAIQSIELERAKNGPFLSFQDFTKRINISLESLEVLIFIGAFRFTGKAKNELALGAKLLSNQLSKKAASPMNSLFDLPVKTFELPTLERSPLEDAFDEIELLGFPVSHSPFAMVNNLKCNELRSKDFPKYQNKWVEILAYYVFKKEVMTSKGRMNFGCWFDQDGQIFDSVHFPDSLKKHPLLGKGCYLLKGQITAEYGHFVLEVHGLEKLPYTADPRYI